MSNRRPIETPTIRAAELGAILAKHYPDAPHHLIGRVVDELQRATRTAKTWEVRRCNEPMTEAQQEAGYRRRHKAQDALNLWLEDLRLHMPDLNPQGEHVNARGRSLHLRPARVELGGDPRGPCGRLHVPGLSGDGWGEGFGIY